MQLNTEDKENLKNLKSHPGWKVLLKVQEEADIKLFKDLSEWDLTNEKNIETLKERQIFKNARNDFFKDTEKHLRKIYVHQDPQV
jgi:hypothetical protein